MAIVPETVLKACPIFKGFTDTGIAIFASIAVPRAFPKGTKPSTKARRVSLPHRRRGHRPAQREEPDRRGHSLGDVTSGEPLGELALVQVGDRLCTATAISDVSALEIATPTSRSRRSRSPRPA